jgi:hypothetical protein
VLFLRRRFNVDIIDRLFYAAIPGLAQLMVLASGIMLLTQPDMGLDCLAAALLLLLLAGIRNAWDMTLWIVLKAPVSGASTD